MITWPWNEKVRRRDSFVRCFILVVSQTRNLGLRMQPDCSLIQQIRSIIWTCNSRLFYSCFSMLTKKKLNDHPAKFFADPISGLSHPMTPVLTSLWWIRNARSATAAFDDLSVNTVRRWSTATGPVPVPVPVSSAMVKGISFYWVMLKEVKFSLTVFEGYSRPRSFVTYVVIWTFS